MMEESRGRQFDPDVLDVFIDRLDEITEIRNANLGPSESVH